MNAKEKPTIKKFKSSKVNIRRMKKGVEKTQPIKCLSESQNPGEKPGVGRALVISVQAR